ncbi:peptide chain release factor 2 [Holzapfeliella floricola]|nr:peptide chain release factor 2 [Holzapfeliella floricola]
MENNEINRILSKLDQKVTQFRGSLDLDSLAESIALNEHQMSQNDFWNNHQTAQKVIDETNLMKKKYDNLLSLIQELDDAKVSFELIQETDDAELTIELENSLELLKEKMQNYELSLLLSDEHDSKNALLEIHPGAGGTESQDWGAMLLRMYQKWADKHHFSVEFNDYQAGEEAGIKSVSLLIKGDNAYGMLKSEHGVHRLVRISPFDSANRRHTSFASVEVMPDIDHSIDITVNDDDLRIDVFRASGAGGQHINKTSSAVRITHLPTGFVTSSQAQRSQLQNKETAMKMLKAKLFQLEKEKQEQEKAAIKGEQLEIGWGSQIRSYVFHPYTMVKDHRTQHEVGNGQSVMLGNLDSFMYAYLQWHLSHQDNN